MEDPWEIKKRYLTTQTFPPKFDQYRYIYEGILQETASMEIKHTLHDPSKRTSAIQYSKVTIRKIIPIAQWGMHPVVTRTIEIGQRLTSYSYWDYVDSFKHVFYYQNPVRNHSWFIRITPTILQNELPSWFLIWWDQFGISMDILPTELKTAFRDWQLAYSHLPPHKDFSMSKLFIHFVIRFNIPWIWKWDLKCDYQNKVPRLKRIFFTRWWDKGMNPTLPDLIKAVAEHTKACLNSMPKQLPVLAPTENPFVQIQAKLRQQYPDISDTELVVKAMKFMKDQFLQSFLQEESSSKASTSTMEEEEDKTANMFSMLAGESQDPNEDNDTVLGDYWDSLTDIITEKIEKNKGKGKDD